MTLQERSQLESAAAARLEAAEATAAAKAEALRNKLEGRIATIAARLGQLAAQEEQREKKRQELIAQVLCSCKLCSCLGPGAALLGH